MSAEAQFSRLNKPEDNKVKNESIVNKKSPTKIKENFDLKVKKKYYNLVLKLIFN